MIHLKLKYRLSSIIVLLILGISCNQVTNNTKNTIASDILDIENVPPQPGEDTWQFIEELKSPMWTQHSWEKADPGPQ